MFNKRGISPLIASVLLIAFTVTLFLIISSFVQKSIVEPGLDEGGEKIANTLDCLSARIDVAESCVQNANDGVRVKVDNIWDVELTGFQIRAVGSTGVESKRFPTDGSSIVIAPLDRKDSLVISIVAANVGTVTSLEIFPEVDNGLCRSNPVVVKNFDKKASC